MKAGDTWTGRDGTRYLVVAPEDVGDRPRYWVDRDMVDDYDRETARDFGKGTDDEWFIGPDDPSDLALSRLPASRSARAWLAQATTPAWAARTAAMTSAMERHAARSQFLSHADRQPSLATYLSDVAEIEATYRRAAESDAV